MDRFIVVLNEDEVERLRLLAAQLGSLERKPPSRAGKIPITALLRDMMVISEMVVAGYPAIIRQALNGDGG